MTATRGRIGGSPGAWVICDQGDTGIEDRSAIALYTKLGVREDVLPFGIAVPRRR